jgi:hypothetical protein
VKGVTPQKRTVRLSLPENSGEIEGASGEISVEQSHKFTLVPADTAHGPIPLTVQLGDGARQTEWMRPAAIDVAPAGKIQLDGRLNDWTDRQRFDWKYFATSTPDFQPEAALSWSAEGLSVAVRMPVEPAAPTNAESFWDWTNFELFLESGDGTPSQWGPQAHQFYFVPVKQGTGWRLVAGEYKRGTSIAKTTFDDPRMQTAARVEAGQLVMEAFIPSAVLGSSPQAGKTWRAAIAMRGLSRLGLTTNASWPAPKEMGLLESSAAWGKLRFVGP